MFAMVVACKKEDGRETIVDQRHVIIGKAAHAVVQTKYVCEDFSTKIRSVSLLKSVREREAWMSNLRCREPSRSVPDSLDLR